MKPIVIHDHLSNANPFPLQIISLLNIKKVYSLIMEQRLDFNILQYNIVRKQNYLCKNFTVNLTVKKLVGDNISNYKLPFKSWRCFSEKNKIHSTVVSMAILQEAGLYNIKLLSHDKMEISQCSTFPSVNETSKTCRQSMKKENSHVYFYLPLRILNIVLCLAGAIEIINLEESVVAKRHRRLCSW